MLLLLCIYGNNARFSHLCSLPGSLCTKFQRPTLPILENFIHDMNQLCGCVLLSFIWKQFPGTEEACLWHTDILYISYFGLTTNLLTKQEFLVWLYHIANISICNLLIQMPHKCCTCWRFRISPPIVLGLFGSSAGFSSLPCLVLHNGA